MATEKQIIANRKNAVLGGRPVSDATLKAQQIRERLVKRFEEKADLYFDALERAAFGSNRARPNVEAAKIMLEQVIGKPKQQIEGSGPNGELLVDVISRIELDDEKD
jgi:hypothetical protein